MITNGYRADRMAHRIRGTVLPDGDVREIFIDGGRITFTGVEDAETLLEDCVLIPGLVDVHAHLTMSFPSRLMCRPQSERQRQRELTSTRESC